MQTRQMITAILAAMAVFLVYELIYSRFFPAPAPQTQPAPVVAPSKPDQPDQPGSQASTTAAAPTTTATTSAPGGLASFQFSSAPRAAAFMIGGGPNDNLGVEVNPIGASVEQVLLTKVVKGRFQHRKSAEGNEPLVLLAPIKIDDTTTLRSFALRQFGMTLGDQRTWDMDGLVWTLAERTPTSATFETTLRGEGDAALVKLKKRYAVEAASSLIRLTITVENVGTSEFSFQLRQDGPLGIVLDDQYTRIRRVVVARRGGDGGVTFEKPVVHNDVTRAERLYANGNEPLLWTALVSKYFGVWTRPLGPDGKAADFLGSARTFVAAAGADKTNSDLLVSFDTRPETLAPGAQREMSFELYAGAKDEDELAAVSASFVDRKQLAYVAVHDFDSSCPCGLCNWPWLTRLLTGLLEFLRGVAGNFGLAIIIIVIIIRTLLHPLSVFQQKSMYRTQDAMARVHPRLEAIKQRYANDKVKLNQETMKIYGEEGINPAAPLLGMVPMFLQMPILISLWTALANDIHLRHAPLDGWWIRDLSAPDALIPFGPDGLTIPILSSIPLIGPIFTNIHSFNVLPVLMGVAMWLQQKYMPKPGMQAKLDAAKQQTAAGQAPSSGMSPEDQLRQQQMMANMMSIMMPIMFYNMPSGLNLYWMATNVFGIVESLIIRKQIAEEKKRREKDGPPPPPKPGRLATWFKNLATEYEQLQKKADEVSGRDPKRGGRQKN